MKAAAPRRRLSRGVSDARLAFSMAPAVVSNPFGALSTSGTGGLPAPATSTLQEAYKVMRGIPLATGDIQAYGRCRLAFTNLPPNACGFQVGSKTIKYVPLTESARKIGTAVKSLTDMERRLKHRDDAAMELMPSVWTPKQWWWTEKQLKKADVPANNPCLTFHLLELLARDQRLSLRKAWERYVENKGMSKSTHALGTIICAIFGEQLPCFAQALARDAHNIVNMQYPSYIRYRKNDWVRPASILPDKKTLHQRVADYAAYDLYYNCMSQRMLYMKRRRLNQFCFDQFFSTFPAAKSEHNMEDLLALPMKEFFESYYMVPTDYAKRAAAFVKKHSVAKRTRALLDGYTASIVSPMFDSQRNFSGLEDALLVLRHEFAATEGDHKTKRAVQIGVWFEMCRQVHTWFEQAVCPGLMSKESTPTTLDTRHVDLDVSDHVRCVAATADAMLRWDTDYLGWWVAKTLCNDPTPVVTPAGKRQPSKISWVVGAAKPSMNVPGRTKKRTLIEDEMEGKHVAFHVSNTKEVVLPAFQDMYVPYDEIQTSHKERPHNPPVLHVSLDKSAKRPGDVFKALQLTPDASDHIMMENAVFVDQLAENTQEISGDLGEEKDEFYEAQDVSELQKDFKFTRSPLIAEMKAMAQHKEPCARGVGEFTKGVFEMLGYGFTLGSRGRPAHLKWSSGASATEAA